jgi:heparan-alpha-glucosaminide N-acetyltransferase
MSERARVRSLDAGRGLAVVLMVLLNEWETIPGTPWWLKHVGLDVRDAMTVQDYGFAAFLFLMGASIPVAHARRRGRYESSRAIAVHTFMRSLILVLLGLFMKNAYHWSPGARDMPRIVPAGWPRGLWDSLVWVGIVLVLCRFEKSSSTLRRLVYGLRALGAALLSWLVWAALELASDETPFELPWMDVLAMIGISYLLATMICLAFNNDGAALVGAMAILVTVYMYARHQMESSGDARWGPIGAMFGTYPAVTMAGVVAWRLLYSPNRSEDPLTRVQAVVGLGAALALEAQLLRPLQGVSRLHGSPSWALWSAAIDCWLLAPIHWVTDVMDWSRLTGPLQLAGQNALVAYLLPWALSSFGILLGLPSLADIAGPSVVLGQLSCVAYTVVVVGLAVLLGKAGIRIGA